MAPDGGLTIRGGSLEVRGLSKAFGGTRVVSDLSFRVEGGALLTLLGPSGSGKTTTLRMIAGFEDPDAGEILVANQDITERSAHRRNIGVVFQQYALFPHLTVTQNVSYPLEMRGYRRADIRSRVSAALDLVRLQGYETRYPSAALGWPAAAGGARPGHRLRAAGAPDGRAARSARQAPPRDHAGRGATAPAAARHHHRLGHPRPGGGPGDVRPHCGDGRWGAASARAAAGGLPAPGDPVRGRLHRGIEPARGDARGLARAAPSPSPPPRAFAS